ncbi:MAG TPA: hypothetical protein VMS88_04125 [Terriglobales bacterium]|nr:hypothetical protein [Terriglobales bacterium]
MLRKLLLAGILVLVPWAAHAASGSAVTSGGFRFGVSLSPNQFAFGGQLAIREFAPDWSFHPSLELGVGDNQTVIQPNFDAYYRLHLQGTTWQPYVGAGIGLAFISEDRPFPEARHDETDVGLNAVFGFDVPTTSGSQWFTELRLGLGDIPNLKIMGGFNFRM